MNKAVLGYIGPFLLATAAFVTIVVFASAVGAASGPGVTDAPDSAPTEVTACRTIDEPGRYVLTDDILNSSAEECITIVASNVVFDGRGHTLDARDVDHLTEGIAAGYTDPPVENITIRNLVVTGWTQGVGCRRVASNVTIRNVTARNNGLQSESGNGYGAGDGQAQSGSEDQEAYGIYIGDMTQHVTVEASLVVNNSVGILVANTSNNMIRDNVVRNNTGNGISFGGRTWNDRILDNRIVNNGGTGLYLGTRTPDGPRTATRIRGNMLRGNARGMFVQHTNTVLSITNNTIRKSTGESIWVAVVNGNVTIANNIIRKGSGDGIVLDATDRVLLRNNTIRNVAGTGILLKYESRNNRLVDNRVHGARRGLRITDTSGRTVVRGLSVGPSRNQSIVLAGSGTNTLVDTTVRGDGSVVVESPGNRLRNLTLDSARVSLRGTDIRLSSVAELPAPPAGKYTVGVGVRVRQVAAGTAAGDHPRLTVYYPQNAVNVTLWRWSERSGWERLHNTAGHPTRSAVTAPLPRGGEFLAVPLASAPFSTPTATPTVTPNIPSPTDQARSPTTGQAGSPSSTGTGAPGFGILITFLTLLSLLLGRVLAGKRRP